MVACFAAELAVPLDELAFIPAFALDHPWTFVTSIFLHANFSHLFFNLLALIMFGAYLERMIGSGRFTALFFISGIVGNFGYMITAPSPYVPAVGASGAIYGIIGCMAVLYPSMVVWVWGIPMPLIFAAFFWMVIDYAGLFLPTGIAHGAHLGGILLGFMYGAVLRGRRTRSEFYTLRF